MQRRAHHHGLGEAPQVAGDGQRQHFEDDAGREPLGPLERPDVSEPGELRKEAGDEAEQHACAALVHEPAADDVQRHPQDARVPRHV